MAFKIPCHLLFLNQQTAVHRFTGAKTEWKQLQKIFLHNNLQHNQFQFRIVYLQNGLIKHPLHTYSSLVTIHMLILAMFNSTIRILFKNQKGSRCSYNDSQSFTSMDEVTLSTLGLFAVPQYRFLGSHKALAELPVMQGTQSQ